ncbi:MAG: 50S ribosomal protein L11 methyltransferase [Gammaproteobacteria bacterium]|nr:50S ribosomal protein L11 methyltransferase [Gammaproteobacteria bacterium]MBL7000120.1 50S ribosomal protein L11 methyltransferase [Gammaproteobacteria bacterium]
MSWWQLTVQTSREDLEKTEDILLQLGALSLTLDDAQDDPIYEPPIGTTPVWPSTSLTGLFEQTLTIEQLYDELVAKLPAHQIASIRKHLLEDQVWERAFLDQYQPILFGKDLWICPSWLQPPVADACNIILDPGIAFGTGTHPTTALCLEFLDMHPPRDKTVLDFGCGSGILGIAAVKLGASRVSFVDIDPQALQATSENAKTNRIDTSQIEISLPQQMSSTAVDYLLANILSGPLVELAPRLSALTRPRGQLVLSGILPSQADQVVAAYQPYFVLDAVAQKDNWCRVSGVRKD